MRLGATPFRLLLVAIAGQFLFGLVLALPGTLFGVAGWTTALGFDVAAQARLLVVFFTGQFLFTALAGALVDRAGCQRVIALGSVVMAAALALLAGAARASEASGAALLLAAGGAAINAGSNTLVSMAYGARRGAMLSVMATFGAVGALMAPLVFRGQLDGAAVSSRLWGLSFLALGVTALPLAVRALGPGPRGQSLLRSAGLLRQRPLLGLIALLALDFGLEAVLAGWIAAYTIAVFPAQSGAAMIALYWSGLCAGRLLTPMVLARSPKLVVVLAAASAAAVSTLGMSLAQTPLVLGGVVLLAGLAVGPLAPTIVSVAGDRYPRQMGAAIGLLLSAAQVGGMVMPWLTGRATIEYGYRAGLIVPALAAAGVAAGTALAWRQRARRVPVHAQVRAQ